MKNFPEMGSSGNDKASGCRVGRERVGGGRGGGEGVEPWGWITPVCLPSGGCYANLVGMYICMYIQTRVVSGSSLCGVRTRTQQKQLQLQNLIFRPSSFPSIQTPGKTDK